MDMGQPVRTGNFQKSQRRNTMSNKKEQGTKGNPLRFEQKEQIYFSTSISKEDLYRIISGVCLLADGLKNRPLLTLRKRGELIEKLARTLDCAAQSIAEVPDTHDI